MSFEIVMVFGLILLAMILFAMDSVRFDLVAMILMSALMLTGILDVKEGLSGFSNPATVTIAAMFALSKGIEKTGALRLLSGYLSKMGRLPLPQAMLLIMGIIALISAFINNTAAVAIFIPVLITTAARMDVSPSKMLLPLSFASMFGGVCTLLGTSTNILVSSIAENNGLDPFGMFEFAPFGLIVLTAGFTYLSLIGIKMVPARREAADPARDIKTVDYISDVRVTAGYSHIGKSLQEVEELWGLDIDILHLYRNEEAIAEKDETTLREDDTLRILGSAREIDELIKNRSGLEIRSSQKWEDADIAKGNHKLLEAVVAPDSGYINEKIRDIDFSGKYEAVVLGLYHRGKTEQGALQQIRLGRGDSILLATGQNRIRDLKQDTHFVLVSDVPVDHYKTERIPISLAVLAGVVLSAALNWVPIAVSACTGVILMVLTGCLRAGDIYRAINWKVIFLLAGVLPLGIAMAKTGAARLLSDFIIQTIGHLGPQAVLSGYFLLTTLLTAMISNQATAAILASLAIETAEGLGVQARPFLMAITFAASLSLITPWGYQTNTMIYGPGRYRFTDFTKVGAPLNLLFWILGTIFIPIFWPF